MRETFPIADDDTWACTHEDGPATVLRVPALERFAMVDPDRARVVVCPDCGTHWRGWRRDKVAKPSIEWPRPPARMRRSPRCDLDVIIELVLRDVPDLVVLPFEQPHPADDDALWWFRNAAASDSPQVEGTGGEFGDCPLTVDGTRCDTPEAAAAEIVRLFRAAQ